MRTLAEYKARRNFQRTPEPEGKAHYRKPGARSAKALPQSGKTRRALTFVVQKHQATRLHYDFRLEMEGVLKSWAVPKGFPTRKGDRRLAVQVEDHPLDYAAFEGIIPEDNYGAGTVMIWDQGSYEVSGEDPLGSLAAGKLHLFLEGTKLKGEWALVRMKDPQAEKPQWLLLKSGEDARPLSESEVNRSATTGRTLEEIASAASAVEWHSDRPKKPVPKKSKTARASAQPRKPASKRPARTSAPAQALLQCPPEEPQFLQPMKALLTASAPEGEEWMYEVKFDGVRALAIKHGREVFLYSRARNDLTQRYPEIAESIRELAMQSGVLDGEIVALDPQGRSSFQLLQSYHATPNKPPLAYYVFDALNLDGRNIRQLPLDQRKAVLRAVLGEPVGLLRFSPGLPAQQDRVMREMQARGLEGLIAKRRSSPYEPGRRSGCWLKLKWSLQQEFVIGGYTEPRGGRTHFGALLVGFFENGNLLFAGKVGTGFDQRALASLHRRFQPLIRKDCPFSNLPEKSAGRFGRGMTAAMMRRCTWLEPELVCQVRFAEWTRDGHLRQPAYLGLRDDKRAGDVVREVPA